jgi:myo-inositol catabolism protein IolS
VPPCERLGMGILAYSALLHGLLTGRYKSADEVPEGRARTRHFSTDRPDARHGEPGKEELTFSTVATIRSIAQENGLTMTELALAWVVHQPQVSAVLAGATKAEQIRENARVAQIRLDDELLKNLDEATRGLRDTFGANADMWQSPGRME